MRRTAGILGYGSYIPWCRIKVADIAKAWGVPFGFPIEKTVPYYDEDSVTMGAEAALSAMDHAGTSPEQIDAIYFGTTTNPYLEKQGSSTIASIVGLRTDALVMDITGSVRSGTAAMLACMDALDAGRIERGLVVGADTLIGEPGQETDYLASAGAAAFVLGKTDPIAEIEESCTYSTEFTDRYRSEDTRFIMTTHPRFVRDAGYVTHVRAAIDGLVKKMGKSFDDFAFAAFSQPDLRFPMALGLPMDKLAPGMVGQYIGYPGSASVLIILAAALDKAKPGERILVASYGEGISDALSVLPTEKIESKRQNVVEEQIGKKRLIDYPTYLRWNRIFERVK